MSKKNDIQKQLDAIQAQLELLGNQLKQHDDEIIRVFRMIDRLARARGRWQQMLEKRAFLFGILLSALIGVVSDFFVSFWFQPATVWTFWGLVLSSALLTGILWGSCICDKVIQVAFSVNSAH